MLPYQAPVPCRRCAHCRQWSPVDELTEFAWVGDEPIAWECAACQREASDEARASASRDSDVGF